MGDFQTNAFSQRRVGVYYDYTTDTTRFDPTTPPLRFEDIQWTNEKPSHRCAFEGLEPGVYQLVCTCPLCTPTC